MSHNQIFFCVAKVVSLVGLFPGVHEGVRNIGLNQYPGCWELFFAGVTSSSWDLPHILYHSLTDSLHVLTLIG